MKHKNIRNCPLAPTSTTDRRRKRWGESLKRLLPGGEGYTESHLLVLVLLTCAGSHHLLPTGPSWHRAGYRQTVSSGVLVFGVDVAQQGLASAVPALSPLTLQRIPDPHTPALRQGEGGGHSKFWTTWAKVFSPILSTLPIQGQQISRGPGKSWAGTDPHQGERFRSPEHRPQFSSCPQQGAPLPAHSRFSISSLPPGSCFQTTNYRLCCIYISFHPTVNPLVYHLLRPSTEPDI